MIPCIMNLSSNDNALVHEFFFTHFRKGIFSSVWYFYVLVLLLLYANAECNFFLQFVEFYTILTMWFFFFIIFFSFIADFVHCVLLVQLTDANDSRQTASCYANWINNVFFFFAFKAVGNKTHDEYNILKLLLFFFICSDFMTCMCICVCNPETKNVCTYFLRSNLKYVYLYIMRFESLKN